MSEATSDAETVAAVVTEAIEANAAARAELLEAVDGLTEAQRRAVWCGTWGVHDIVAHLVRWQDTIASGLEVLARGKRPMLPEYEGDDDAFNAESARRFRDTSWEALLAALMQAREHHEAASKALVGQVSADRVEEGKTGRRFLFHPSNHEPEHIKDILRWRRESGLG